MFQVRYDISMEFSTWNEWIKNRIIRVYACKTFGIRWKSRGIHISYSGEMWQHDKSAHTYIIQFVLHWHCFRKQDGRKQPVLRTFCAYWGTHGSSFLSNSMSDFHCSPSANITSGLPISGMDGNSGNSFRIKILFLNVIILFHWIWFLRVFCWRMYLISYEQGIVACQWLAWLSFMF